MGIKSTIKSLAPDILEQLQALLRDPRVTQLDATARINAILLEQGEEPLSKSAVNRYSLSMDKVGQKLSQSRDVADMWIAKLGNQPAGKVGLLINEMVRTLAFDATLKLSDDEKPPEPKLIKELAMAVRYLEEANLINEKNAAQIRQKAREEAAVELTTELKNDGISAELEASIKRILLGK